MVQVCENQAANKNLKTRLYGHVPMASREFTAAECYTNESSFGEIGHAETATTYREIVANHLVCVYLRTF